MHCSKKESNKNHRHPTKLLEIKTTKFLVCANYSSWISLCFLQLSLAICTSLVRRKDCSKCFKCSSESRQNAACVHRQQSNSSWSGLFMHHCPCIIISVTWAYTNLTSNNIHWILLNVSLPWKQPKRYFFNLIWASSVSVERFEFAFPNEFSCAIMCASSKRNESTKCACMLNETSIVNCPTNCNAIKRKSSCVM